MERLKSMKESLMNCVQSQINGNLQGVDTKELGEAIDMIKDLEEAMYYCSVVKAMEESKKEKEASHYAEKYYPKYDYDRRDMDRHVGKLYYGDLDPRYYPHTDFENRYTRMYPPYRMENNTSMPMRDIREGRSPQSRKTYMESKELHHDEQTQIKELEKYMQELTTDITEMIVDATPAEKQVLQQKISALAAKIR